MKKNLQETIEQTYESQPLFRQALTEFLGIILPYMEGINASDADYARLERIMSPERMVVFKVVWEDKDGNLMHNTGYRIQFNSALGPYKGGLRFDPTVSEDILKFLAFEQIFKNSLTGLPLGGGKGGSDFNPKGKTDSEIFRFCVSFMTELSRHIGPYTDVPAGDIGVGNREIGYLYGAYKKIMNRADGILTGKGVAYNGSHIRTEATGYGVVYFVRCMLGEIGKEIKDLSVVISGSGNVAQHTAEKWIMEGGKVLTLSDREGYLYSSTGLNQEDIESIKVLKRKGGSLSGLTLREGVEFKEGNLWQDVSADVYIPGATQNELEEKDAEAIVKHGAFLVAEGANMPLTLEAVHVLQDNGVIFGPAKAANAGGVSVSGLEMSQNASHISWSLEEVDSALQKIMKGIHKTCATYGRDEAGKIDYVKGANIGGFQRVFTTMKELGW